MYTNLTDTNKCNKILIVEDDPLSQSILLSLLQSWSMVADISQNGDEAVRTLEKQEYDLVLMDIEMPGMNGYEATQYIRQQLKLNMPIIAVSSNSLESDKENPGYPE